MRRTPPFAMATTPPAARTLRERGPRRRCRSFAALCTGRRRSRSALRRRPAYADLRGGTPPPPSPSFDHGEGTGRRTQIRPAEPVSRSVFRCRGPSHTARSWPLARCGAVAAAAASARSHTASRTSRQSTATRSEPQKSRPAIPSRRRSRSAPAQILPPSRPRQLPSACAASRVSTVPSSRAPLAGTSRNRRRWSTSRMLAPSRAGRRRDLTEDGARAVGDGQPERHDPVFAVELAHHDRGENARIDVAAAEHEPDASAGEARRLGQHRG